MSAENKLRTTCRVCNSSNLTELFSLGEQFVSNFTDKKDIKTGPKCEIALQFCNNCTLIQQKWTAPQDFLYTRHYWYRSGVTQTMRDALKDIVHEAIFRVDLQENDIVLDIGANDGTLLSCYGEYKTGDAHLIGKPICVAVEPAKNMHSECLKHCEILLNSFWSASSYFNVMTGYKVNEDMGVSQPKAKIITAIGMFYDLESPSDFIADVAKVLHPKGIFVCQLMCAKQMLENMDVGNLSHEHLEFYTLSSLQYLFEQNGLMIEDIEENKVNGGSYRLYVRHQKEYETGPLTDAMRRIYKYVREEVQSHVYMVSEWREWYKKLETYKSRLRAFITSEVDKGKSVWIYGASTKGNVILQWLDVNNEDIPFAADKSEEKWGKYTVGTGIKIVSEDEMRKAKPDYLFVLPYSFVDEFIERERDLLRDGTRLIVPLPQPYTVSIWTEKYTNKEQVVKKVIQ